MAGLFKSQLTLTLRIKQQLMPNPLSPNSDLNCVSPCSSTDQPLRGVLRSTGIMNQNGLLCSQIPGHCCYKENVCGQERRSCILVCLAAISRAVKLATSVLIRTAAFVVAKECQFWVRRKPGLAQTDF